MKTSLVNQTHFERFKKYLHSILKTASQMIYGATVYEMVRDLKKERAHLEHLFVLIVFGDFFRHSNHSTLLCPSIAAVYHTNNKLLETNDVKRTRYYGFMRSRNNLKSVFQTVTQIDK